MSYGILYDSTQCIGCEGCMYACREKNNLPENEEHKLSARNYTVLKTVGDVYYRQMCMHCEEPTCASVCPVGALQKTSDGPVVYDATKCIGCRYCIMACPFDVPKYKWGSANPVVTKCVMCYDRIKDGEVPACADICPTGATKFGKRDELLKEAHARIEQNPDTYFPYVYGEKEAGGTSVLMLSSVSFAELGLPVSDEYKNAFPSYTWKAQKEIPNVVLLGGTFLYGLWWVINRRMDIENGNLAEPDERKEK